MEFIVIFIIFLVALTIALGVSVSRSGEIARAQRDMEAFRVAGILANRINTVHLEGSGFSMNCTLPDKVFGMNYSISVYSNQVVLVVGGNTHIKTLLTSNVSGSPVKGINIITNIDGGIVISEAA
jgi:hypothetical protein